MNVLNVIHLEVMLIEIIFTENARFTAFSYLCRRTSVAAATRPRQDLMPRQQQKDRKQDYRRWKDKNPRIVSGLKAHGSELASMRKSPRKDHAGKPP